MIEAVATIIALIAFLAVGVLLVVATVAAAVWIMDKFWIGDD